MKNVHVFSKIKISFQLKNLTKYAQRIGKRFGEVQFKGVFYKFFFTFCIFMILPILVSGIVVYYLSKDSVIKEIYKTNEIVLNQVSDILDKNIEDIYDTTFMLSQDAIVNDAFSYGKENPQKIIHATADIRGIINGIISTKKFINNIALYVNGSNHIIDSEGISDFDFYFSRNSKYETMELEDWKEIMNRKNSFYTIPFLNYDSMGRSNSFRAMNIITSLPFGQSPKATVVFNISETAVLKVIKNVSNQNDLNLFVVNNENRIITGQSSMSQEDIDYFKERVLQTFSTDQNSKARTLHDKKFYVSYRMSKYNGWSYFIVLSAKQVEKQIHYIKIIMIVVLLILLGVSVVLSAIVASKMYRPIKSIVEYLGSSNQSDLDRVEGRKDELGIISSLIKKIRFENTALNDKMDLGLPYIKEKLIEKIMHGGFNNVQQAEKAARVCGMEFFSKHHLFKVLILKIHFSEAFEAQYKEEKEMLKSRTSRVIFEVLNSAGETLIYESGDNEYIMIAGFMEETEQQKLADALKDIMVVIDQDQGFLHVVVASGKISKGILEIKDSFEDAKKCMSLRHLLQENQLLESSTLNYEQYVGKYSVKNEKLLIDLLISGQEEKVIRYIDEVLEENSREPLIQMKRVVFSITNLGLWVATEKGCDLEEISWYTKDPYEYLNSLYTITELKRYLNDFYMVILESIKKQKTEEFNENILEVKKYVDDHYYKDISLEQTAEYFGVSAAYLSKIFKESTGINFVNYVNRMRINKAKELLLEDDCKIYEVAEKIGYMSSNTFVRTFKEYEGMSPGRYRKLYK